MMGMVCVDELDQIVGVVVGFVYVVLQYIVIFLIVGFGKGIDWYQFDEVDFEIDQVIQFFDGGVECVSCGECVDV